jgi:hypothetical protein
MTSNEEKNLHIVILVFMGILFYDWVLYLTIVSCWTIYEVAHFFVDYLVSIGKQYVSLIKYEHDYEKAKRQT